MTEIVGIGGPSKPKRRGFQPGVSGNPAGRPPGIPNKMAQHRRQLYEAMPGILDALIANAQASDSTAIKLLLERTLPPLKSGYAPVSLPDVGDSLVDQGAAIVRAMTSGEVGPDAGNVLLQALTAQSRLVESQELAQRIERLEASLKERQR